jgi:hypothetical protein
MERVASVQVQHFWESNESANYRLIAHLCFLYRFPTGREFIDLNDPDLSDLNSTFCLDVKDGSLSPAVRTAADESSARTTGGGIEEDVANDASTAGVGAAREGVTTATAEASGWRTLIGGAGGSKVWLFANSSGAAFTVRTPAPATHYMVSVYTHHDLPLGLLKVTVGDDDTTVIDPCCKATHCEGTGPGRGLYKEFRVPSTGELQAGAHTVLLEVVARSPDAPLDCARRGVEMSLVGLNGYVV